MDKRLTFNEDEVNYDKWRPRYCDELFVDIVNYSKINSEKHAIEIGCGTGQATEPILKTGCAVTAIELGDKLALFSQTKFRDYNNFQVKNISFEDFQYECDSVDLVYSATAFHWIPEDIGFKKAFDMLKKSGTIALFWNKPGRDNDILHQKLQVIYDRYIAEGAFPAASKNHTDNNRLGNHSSDRHAAISDAVTLYGFVDFESHIYKQTRIFNPDNYLCLLETYSDHRIMLSSAKKRFYGEIKSAINDCGGIIEIHDTIDLYLARKP